MVFSRTTAQRGRNPELVPVFPVGVHGFLKHLLQGFIKALHEPVGLGVVHRCPELFDLEEAEQFFHYP